VQHSLLLGQSTAIIEQLLAGLASSGLHFAFTRSLRITADVGELAMQWTTTNIGTQHNVPQVRTCLLRSCMPIG
jgi:hypothetical protein